MKKKKKSRDDIVESFACYAKKLGCLSPKVGGANEGF